MPNRIYKLEGPPGSGKTHALAQAACRLVQSNGLQPSQILILAITPQNKRRLRHYLQQEAKPLGFSPNAFALFTWEEWLLETLNSQQAQNEANTSSANQPLRLLTEQEARILLHEILKQSIPKGHPLFHASQKPSMARAFWELIRFWQVKGISPDTLIQAEASATLPAEERLQLLIRVYQQFLNQIRQANLRFPAELASQTLQTLRSDPAFRERLIHAYTATLADEAQELSKTHYELLNELPGPLHVAGQASLSIRQFRGAEPEMFQIPPFPPEIELTHETRPNTFRENDSLGFVLDRWLPRLSKLGNPYETGEPHIDFSMAPSPAQQEKLATLLQFGFYTDAEQEAMGIATALSDFIARRQVDSRPAQWQDCAILLRSSHFKPFLIAAFLEKKIPFQSDSLSESVISLQHQLYDFLQVLSGLETLGFTPDALADVSTARAALKRLQLGYTDSIEGLQPLNRHLRRWLEACLSEVEPDLLKQHWLSPEVEETASDDFLWITYLESHESQALHDALGQLTRFYAHYRNTGQWLSLWDELTSLILQSQAAFQQSDEIKNGLQSLYETLNRLNHYYQEVFRKPLPLADVLANYPSLWDGLEPIAESTGNTVKLLSLHQAQGESFPWVIIPFLVAGDFPQTHELPELVPEEWMRQHGLLSGYRLEPAEEARLLALGITRASQRVLLSCHQAEGEDPVQPSQFYRQLLDAKRACLQQASLSYICASESSVITPNAKCAADICHCKAETASVLEESYTRYTGDSRWASLERQAEEPLQTAGATVSLSASSIRTYMACPKQFYYRHVLRLKKPTSASASLGLLAHKVMEVFNRQAEAGNYTPERLKILAQSLFQFDSEPESFKANGFSDDDARRLRQLSPLGRVSLQKNLLEAVDDLVRQGYFSRYQRIRQIIPEKQLDDVELPGLGPCRIRGAVDALVQLEDGRWEILDYKTYASKYSSSVALCEQQFQSTLDPLPDDETLDHTARFASKMHNQYPKDYQLPLYYWACEQESLYQGNLNGVALQIIRPPLPDKPEQGSIRLNISAEALDAQRDRLLDELRRYIVEPIASGEAFVANPGSACSHCSYFSLCDAGQSTDSAEGAEA